MIIWVKFRYVIAWTAELTVTLTCDDQWFRGRERDCPGEIDPSANLFRVAEAECPIFERIFIVGFETTPCLFELCLNSVDFSMWLLIF